MFSLFISENIPRVFDIKSSFHTGISRGFTADVDTEQAYLEDRRPASYWPTHAIYWQKVKQPATKPQTTVRKSSTEVSSKGVQ